VASKVASSTNVDIAEVTAFHSSGVFVFARNTNYINQQADSKDFKHSYFLIDNLNGKH
jgi:aspartyl/asparaginyl beta-hydroxylase (cupin superfamily)